MESACAFLYSKWGAVTLGAAFLYVMKPGPVQQGTGFVDFVKDKKIKGNTVARKSRKPADAETSINNFFKDKDKPRKVVPAGRETDFNRFLKSTAVEAGQESAAQAPQEVDPLAGKPAVDVLLLYGTEYGFSKEICTKVQDTLRKTAVFRPTMVNMADVPAGVDFAAKGFQAVLVMCSTQGDGVPPSEAREFCEWLGSPKAPALGGLPFGVLALGDKAYVHFCKCGKALDARFEELGGKRVVDRSDVDREDWPVVDAWITSALNALTALKLAPQMPKAVANGVHSDAPAAALPPSKSRPYTAKLVAKEGLCVLAGPEDKDTIRLEFDIEGSGLEYLPGDALGVYPRNEPMEVARVLRAAGASGKEMLPAPSGHYAKGSLSLREALSACYDLRSPRGALLELLTKRAAGAEADELRGLLSAEGGANPDKNKALDKWLSVRHVSDILEGCPSVSLGYQELLPCLKQLQPRLYSISSSPLEAPGRVQITVAIVRYKALDRPRVGVCSTFVGERLNVGDSAPVYVTKNPEFRLPESPLTPVIMVGPGTGLAPFRSFIKHRLLTNPQPATRGPLVLFFGCRHQQGPSCDYLYGPQLEAWGKDGTLELHTAFSRDTAKKVYVQHRLAEAADRVWELLEQGAHFYVCGDANHMAGDVDRELRKLIAERAGGEAAAAEYVKRLEEGHRYERDVWFS